MNADTSERAGFASWTVVAAGAVRAGFGVVMALDAYLKWQPAFAEHYVGYLRNAALAQPRWLDAWFQGWLRLVESNPDFFISATRWIETLIAVGLLLGFARRFIYYGGAIFSLLIWSTAEGFSGPYTAGATNIGPALVYALVFVALAIFARLLGSTPYSVDYHLARRYPRWGSWVELAPPEVWRRPPAVIALRHQFAAVGAIAIALGLAVGTLRSAMNVPPPTPTNAAAAVTPLSLYNGLPVQQAHPARLPPLLGTGDSVGVTLIATDTTVEIANGVQYNAWTFNGTVPGPVLHVRQGQTVNVTFVNRGHMPHSIDFHAAEVAPSVAYRTIAVGETLQFSFLARTAGAFVYHCGTPPVLLHMGNGMYGVIIVDPATPLPPADVSYVLLESEWYTQHAGGTVMNGDYAKMLAGTPDEMVFNGEAFQYNDQPLTARTGQRVRWYVLNAGPNRTSAFHVIGSMFAAVYPDGDAAHALTGVSTYVIGPGQGVVLDTIMRESGDYPFVDHSMRAMTMGAVGTLRVGPAEGGG
ncbi:multicopper oxidase domain-containing protein [Opitutus terrae]|uniref:Copper-containing nitrite reductase n=1 Tax=Opitutus terrae (strain DSM 11246 / JCM 15787 / PB90-1) TaxID=452637 RepID=B1ZXT9_OPITP|nr:multicopper oxidase domain-containing protein [Opitutus terrae]ACB74307.1 Nitrite reductase (NO-forming) [Opitutus terrae PB90-1]